MNPIPHDLDVVHTAFAMIVAVHTALVHITFFPVVVDRFLVTYDRLLDVRGILLFHGFVLYYLGGSWLVLCTCWCNVVLWRVVLYFYSRVLVVD